MTVERKGGVSDEPGSKRRSRRNKISTPRFNPEFVPLRDSKGETLKGSDGKVCYDKSIPGKLYLVYRFDRDKDGKVVRLKYSIRESVLQRYWMSKRQMIKVTAAHPEHDTVNKKLQRIKELALVISNRVHGITVQRFKEELDYSLGYLKRPVPKMALTLFEFIEKTINREKNKVNSTTTWKKYNSLYNHLKKYAKEKGKPEILFEDVNMDLFHDFTNFLYSPPRNHSRNTTSKNIESLKTFMKRSFETSYANDFEENVRLHDNQIHLNPFFNVTRVNTTKVVLSFDELQVLFDIDLKNDERLDRVRDLWLIAAFSGLRVSDFSRLKPENINREGKYDIININTFKGRNTKRNTNVSIPLLPQLKIILEKHSWSSPKAISDQKMNEYIKELCLKAGITSTFERKFSERGETKTDYPPKWKHITNHSARYSFITNFLSLGVTAEKLSKITGQSIKTLLGYEQIDKEKNALSVAESLPKLFEINIPLKVVK